MQGSTSLREVHTGDTAFAAETSPTCEQVNTCIHVEDTCMQVMCIRLFPLKRQGSGRRIAADAAIAPGGTKGHKRAWHLAALRWSAQPTRFRCGPRFAAVLPHPSSFHSSGLSRAPSLRSGPRPTAAPLELPSGCPRPARVRLTSHLLTQLLVGAAELHRGDVGRSGSHLPRSSELVRLRPDPNTSTCTGGTSTTSRSQRLRSGCSSSTCKQGASARGRCGCVGEHRATEVSLLRCR